MTDLDPEKPNLKLSSVGFKLTPALKRQVTCSTRQLRKEAPDLHRLRAKLRLFTNGPRRDTYSVRFRLEQPGPDLVTEQRGDDLYPLIQMVADTTLERIRRRQKRRQRSRRATQGLPPGQTSQI